MLIEFNVKNFRSIREAECFSLVKDKGDELEESNSFDTNTANKIQLLRSAAVYGANASGKSNLLRALRVMEKVVSSSASRNEGDELPITPFRLDEKDLKNPSEFEVSFIAEGIRYQYGFAASSERIHEEWLLAYPKGRAQQWYAREWDVAANKYSWDFGNAFKGEKLLWKSATRKNALFLSTAIQLNSEQLKPVYNWFNNTLRVANFPGWSHGYSASLCESPESKARLLEFLKAADIDIDDLDVFTEEFDPKSLPSELPQAIRDIILDEMKDKEVYDIRTLHRNTDGDLVSFELDDESDGTKKLFALAGPWLDCLKNGYVLFLDELHDNLHPNLVKFLVQLFHSNKSNPKNAQLVFTTHETSILNQEVFRRDQIWFCEKTSEKATKVYPLTDFSPRKHRDNLEAAYLAGRYGAVPATRRLNLVS